VTLKEVRDWVRDGAGMRKRTFEFGFIAENQTNSTEIICIRTWYNTGRERPRHSEGLMKSEGKLLMRIRRPRGLHDHVLTNLGELAVWGPFSGQLVVFFLHKLGRALEAEFNISAQNTSGDEY
jgi:hypothetical protein